MPTKNNLANVYEHRKCFEQNNIQDMNRDNMPTTKLRVDNNKIGKMCNEAKQK